MIFLKYAKFKKITEANTRKLDTKFACKNPLFDFHAGQFTRDIVFQKFATRMFNNLSCFNDTIQDLIS